MLKELHIKNFALLDELRVEFRPGLNILTGETGAGKSIIINALNLALGCRADPECIRSGHDSATVEALFLMEGREEIRSLAEASGLETDEGQLIVKRVVSRSGKNKIFINGSSVPLAVLGRIGDALADIHGQHQHQALFVTENHLRFLDAFGGLESDREEFQKREEHYRSLKMRIERKEESERERARKKDQLRYEIDEIKKASPSPAEEEELLAEVKKLRNTERLSSVVEGAFKELYDADGSALGVVKRMHAALAPLVEFDNTLQPLVEASDAIAIQMDDLSANLRDYAAGLEFHQEKLEELEDRLEEIRALKRKYGASVEQVLSYLGKAEGELAALEAEDENYGKLHEELSLVQKELQSRASKLAGRREEESQKFSKKLKKELVEMNMEKVEFLADFLYEGEESGEFQYRGRPAKLAPHGFGKMEFLFSSNPGEAPRPLSKIASGGEISRVMLALKNILPGKCDVPTMVFDEVDTGIGGKVAEKVGEKLMKISKGRQVLCITHLPQIAGMATVHYSIEKSFSGGKTSISIRELNKKERVDEIARMSSGAVITEATRRHAEQMIKTLPAP